MKRYMGLYICRVFCGRRDVLRDFYGIWIRIRRGYGVVYDFEC